jgi:hypothetical protein
MQSSQRRSRSPDPPEPQAQEVVGGFVISGGDGAKVLQATEGSFDDVGQAVSCCVEGKEPLAIGLVGMTGVVERLCRKRRR